MKRRIALVAAVVCFTAWQIACGGGGGSVNPTPEQPAPTATLVANPTMVNAGAAATLSWTTTNASSAAIDNSIGSVTPVASGSVTVHPSVTTTYTLTAQGAGGTTTATAIITVPVNVAVSGPSTIPLGQTGQYAASVTGTTNTAVTWSTSAGTISSSGLLTTAGLAQGTVITVTATSQADQTASGSLQVTVGAREIVLNWQASAVYTLLSPADVPNFQDAGASNHISATGIQVGDIVTTTDPSGSVATYTITATDVANGWFNGLYYYNCPACGNSGTFVNSSYAPHFIKIQVSSSDGTVVSAPLWVPLTTDQPTMALSPDGTTAYFSAGGVFRSVNTYRTANGSSLGTTAGPNNVTLAMDLSTGNLFSSEDTATQVGFTTYWTSTLLDAGKSQAEYTSSSSNALMGIAAANGVGYATDFVAGTIDMINLGTMAVSYQTPDGNMPWSLDLATVNGNLVIASYSAGDATIHAHDKDLNPLGTLAVTSAGITPLAVYKVDGWPLRIFNSGYAVLLSVYDQKLVEAKLDSQNNLTIVKSVALTGNAINIAKDETHQAIIVWTADTGTGTSKIWSYDLATLTPTAVAAANTLPQGFEASAILVSPDGSKLYVGGINFTADTAHGFAANQPAFYVIPNQ